ncbi:MAG: hypothetical protein HQL31_06070 [Planctomycetes bacterium]|nr:hypothetical protein [Planctomycetota bacterium]
MRHEMDREVMGESEMIEISKLDIRFESLKVRDRIKERSLLAILAEGEFHDPLLVVSENDAIILLDGFKRLRCMRRLGWGLANCVFIGTDEAGGILELVRRSRGHRMNLYEEAGFVQELHGKHEMPPAQIAECLGRTKSWVSMRVQFLKGMSEDIRHKIQTGEFPLHAWMYSVQPFMRMNGPSRKLGEEFVNLICKEQATLRETELLARAWFEGGETLRKEMRDKGCRWLVKRLQKPVEESRAMSAVEQKVCRQLLKLGELISTLSFTPLPSNGKRSRDFRVQAHLACTGILANLGHLKHALEELYAECGAT